MIILVRDKQKRLDPVMSHYDLLIQIFIDNKMIGYHHITIHPKHLNGGKIL